MAFGYLSALRNRRVARTVALVSLSVALVGSSVALAQEADSEATADEPTIEVESVEPPAPVDYRPGEDVIVFSFPDDDGVFVDCTLAIVLDELGVLTTDMEGCSAVGTLGPNGQSNHGQVVRAFVHSLKNLEYDGPRGHLVRNVAKSDFGKKDKGAGETVETEIAETDNTAGKAKGKNKPKPNRGRR